MKLATSTRQRTSAILQSFWRLQALLHDGFLGEINFVTHHRASKGQVPVQPEVKELQIKRKEKKRTQKEYLIWRI